MSGKGIKIKSGCFVHAVLYVPLQLRGINLGVLGVSNRSAYRAFSQQDEFLLSFLADYAAIALENARVFQAADQALTTRLEELNTLIHITQTITSSLDLDEVIHLTIQQVHDSWNIEASSLWLLDEETQMLRVLTNVGTAVEELEKLELRMGQGIVGKVVKSGKPIYTNDVAGDEDHYREADEKTGFKTRSLLCVPLIFRGQVVGAMQLLNKKDGDFGEIDLERARAIAAAVAIAVSNALLFDEAESRKHQLENALHRLDIVANSKMS
jgi:GAF domain-containing protein